MTMVYDPVWLQRQRQGHNAMKENHCYIRVYNPLNVGSLYVLDPKEECLY
jgi:hypothetical protein